MKGNILVFIYNSIADPIIQNLMITYIKTLSDKREGKMVLVTFEQAEYRLSNEAKAGMKKDLLGHNIVWKPMYFHSGRFLLLKKLWDMVQSLFLVTMIRLKYQTGTIFSYTNVASAMAGVLSKLLFMRLVIFSYEPHCDFLVETGQWPPNSIKYKILKSLEMHAAVSASHIMTGTKHMVNYLKTLKVRAKLYWTPNGVDEEKFVFDETSRDQKRKELGLTDQKLVVYFGKLGGIYYEKELVEGISALNNILPNPFFLIGTNYDHGRVKSWMDEYNIPANRYLVRGFIDKDDMSGYLSAADFGLVIIPPTPSQKYRSPIKVAEYMLCGVPYMVCKGISEDDDYALECRVGVVVEKFAYQEIIGKGEEVLALIHEDKKAFLSRSRAVGLDYRSKQRIDDTFEEIFCNEA